jgi:anti-anti-sigma regulatory factor
MAHAAYEANTSSVTSPLPAYLVSNCLALLLVMSGRIDNEPTGAAVNWASAGACETAAPQVGTAEPTRDFALALDRRSSGTAVLVLVGELDLYRAPDVERALGEAIGAELHGGRCKPISDDGSADGGEIRAREVRRVAVDLRSVTFIDSTTLAMLLAVSRCLRARGGELLVLVGPRTPMTAFEVTGFDRLLAIRRMDDHPGKSAA